MLPQSAFKDAIKRFRDAGHTLSAENERLLLTALQDSPDNLRAAARKFDNEIKQNFNAAETRAEAARRGVPVSEGYIKGIESIQRKIAREANEFLNGLIPGNTAPTDFFPKFS
ncbi:hypothetical protein [Tuwongella immobilis]|uniref:hypothetical protein n=1 Tax=Tuwongella immobilis TaxID=692036 RepID=UPI001E5EC284|nr:hypothetical protein [Tuwongella immobilis]